MFTSFYLSHTAEGVENLFWFTLACAVVYFVGCLTYRDGRTPRAIKRALIGLAVADAMVEFAYYLGYMEYFPGYESLGEAARMFPGVAFPVIFFVCSWFFVKIMNDMLR